MALDVPAYRSIFEAQQVLRFVDRELIKRLVEGFFHSYHAGIACYICKFNPIEERWDIDDRIDHVSLEGDDLKYYNLVCLEYLRSTGAKRPKCTNCDNQNALLCVNNRRTEPYEYECWLGFKEFAFPIVVSGHVVGVLLAGQIIDDENSTLGIADRIQREIPDGVLQQELIGYLQQEWVRQNEEEFVRKEVLRSKMAALQAVLNGLLNTLYVANRTAKGQELLHESANYLASSNIDSEEEWWSHCQKLIDDVCQISGLRAMEVYERSASRFYRRLPQSREPEKEVVQLPAALVCQHVEIGKLVRLSTHDKEAQELVTALSVEDGPVHLFRHDTAQHDCMVSTLIVLFGGIRDSTRTLIHDFCRTVSMRFAIEGLVFRLRKTHSSYRLQVGHVAHSFRTPLQALELDLDAIMRALAPSSDVVSKRRVQESKERLFDAKEDLHYLLDTLKEGKQSFNFIPLVVNALSLYTPFAEAHPCELVPVGKWPEKAPVYANPTKLKIALWNLIDNAIKYSYQGETINQERRLHQVRVWITTQNGMVEFRITNYGIGIPLDIVEAVQNGQPGHRAEVRDTRKNRSGTGWGLATAWALIESEGGYIEIRSNPADKNPRRPDEQYHRYLTDIRVGLHLQQLR